MTRTPPSVVAARILVASLVALGGGARPALAQAPPAPTSTLPTGTIQTKTATTGSTNLVTSGISGAAAVPQEEDEQYANDLSLSLGGLFATGNARTIALTTAAKLRLRRFQHQVTAGAATNFARAAQRGQEAQTTVENYQGLARYDLFLSQRVSIFLAGTARRDRFQGLDLRVNVDPGVAYHFIETKNQRLVLELGYDVQYDIRRDDALVTQITPPDPNAEPITVVYPKTQDLHNTRGFLGYENRLYPEVSFISSLEHIQNFESLGIYRFVFDIGLKSTIRGKLAVSATYTLRYENRPLPTYEKADSLVSVALVYTF